MARNEEKAQAMLNRWWTMKRNLYSNQEHLQVRPKHASDINSLHECEKWRNRIIYDISKDVALIQNAGLGEFKIRQLNDSINKMLRVKRHWEDRIKELGGCDHRRIGSKLLDSQGYELPGSGGYKYFGAAKDLPGVRDLFHKEVPPAPKQNASDLYKLISYDYYGMKQNQDQELLAQEKAYEQQLREKEMQKWILNNQKLIKTSMKDKMELENLTMDEIQELIDFDYDKFKKEHETVEPIYKNYDKQQNEDKGEDDLDALEKRKKEILSKYFQEDKNEFIENEEQVNISQVYNLSNPFNKQQMQSDY